MKSISFDRAADFYDETRSLPPHAMAKTVSKLLETLEGSKRILEVGAGTGRFTVALQKAGLDVVAADISRKMLMKGIDKGMRQAVLGDALNLPFLKDSFDAALSVHFLHLAGDWILALRELARTVRGDLVAIFDRNVGLDLREVYDEMVARAGFQGGIPGKREHELVRILSPREIVHLVTFAEQYESDSTLADLGARRFASQWDVPTDIHSKAMKELYERFGGQKLERLIKIEIAVWDAKELSPSAETFLRDQAEHRQRTSAPHAP